MEKPSVDSASWLGRAFPTLWKPFVPHFIALFVVNIFIVFAVAFSSGRAVWFFRTWGLELPPIPGMAIRLAFVWLALAIGASGVALAIACFRNPGVRVMSRWFTVQVLLELLLVAFHALALSMWHVDSSLGG